VAAEGLGPTVGSAAKGVLRRALWRAADALSMLDMLLVVGIRKGTAIRLTCRWVRF